jgi:hypothetical protein
LVVDVAGLRALTDDELIRRHDAPVAQGGDAGARSTIYLDELRARVAEQQVEAVMRRLLAILVVTGLPRGMLMLFESRLGEALRLEAPQQALQRLQSLGLMIGDAEPLRRALQQRFDLPFPTRPVPRIEVAAANVAGALDEFREGARVAAELAIVNPISSWPIVVVVDPDANQTPLAGSIPDDRWAHWSAVVAGPHALVRLDLVARQTPLAAWVWPDPPQELVRATSSGPHHIAVVSAAIPDERRNGNCSLRQHRCSP